MNPDNVITICWTCYKKNKELFTELYKLYDNRWVLCPLCKGDHQGNYNSVVKINLFPLVKDYISKNTK